MWLNNETAELERLIDRHGLAEVLDAISGICSDKADHIRASYSDVTLAKAWQDASRQVARCAASDNVRSVTP